MSTRTLEDGAFALFAERLGTDVRTYRASARGLVRLRTTVPALAAVAYVLLLILHRSYYGALGVSSADVGVSRAAFTDQPLAALGLLVAVTVLLLIAFVALAITVTAFVDAAAFAVGVQASRRAKPSRRAYWARIAHGLRKEQMVFPRKLVVVLGIGAAVIYYSMLLSGVSTSVRDVKQGSPMRGYEPFGVPLIDVRAARVTVIKGPEPAATGALDAATIDDCWLYLGRSDDGLAFFDVARQQPVILPATEYAVAVELGRQDRVSEQCLD